MAPPEKPRPPGGPAAPGARPSDGTRSNSRRRRRSIRRRNVVLAIAGSFLLAGALGTVAWNWTPAVVINQVDFCPEPEPTAIHAVLVDRSDPISSRQRQRVREVLERAVAEAPVGSRVALYVAEADDVELLRPRVALCNPGTVPSRLYPSPASLQERYAQAFKTEIDQVLQALEGKPERTLSPVMEAIRAVCVDSFRNAAAGGPLRLTVIGEMTQYSRIANHYTDRNFDAMIGGSRLDPVLADCKGAEVDVTYLLRPTPTFMPGPQGLAHRRFWELFLQKMKARPRNVDVVPFGS